MAIPQERTERIEALRGLIERLSAPDLTLSEAKVLRESLSDLLEPGDRRGRPEAMIPAPTLIAPSDRGDAPCHDLWSPDRSIRVAGCLVRSSSAPA